MPNNVKLGSGLEAIFGSDINIILDDIQSDTEPIGVTTTNAVFTDKNKERWQLDQYQLC